MVICKSYIYDYYFARIAITRHHKLSSLNNNKNVLSHKARNLKSACQWLIPSEGCEEESVHFLSPLASSWLLTIFGLP